MGEEALAFSEEVEEWIKKEFGDEANFEFINLLKLGKATFEHGYNGFIERERFLEWAGRVYDGGVQQRQISNLEKEGNVIIGFGDIANSASYLHLFGKEEGYLSRK